jgi:hypothetical protein
VLDAATEARAHLSYRPFEELPRVV